VTIVKIIKQSWNYYNPFLEVTPLDYFKYLRIVEGSARTCYQSVGEVEKSEQFVKKLIKRGHLSPLEHINISLMIKTDRSVLSELTRHRLASFSVESQRFVKYNEIEFIKPVWFSDEDYIYTNKSYAIWVDSCDDCEVDYKTLLLLGQQPQQARMVLNNSVKVDLIATANLREWRHILSLRTKMDNNPQMKELMTSILIRFEDDMSVFFEDIKEN